MNSLLVFILLVIISLILYGIYSRFSRRNISLPIASASSPGEDARHSNKEISNLPVVAAITWEDINKAIKARDLTRISSSHIPLSSDRVQVNVGKFNGNHYVLMLNQKPIAKLPLYMNK